MALPQVGGAAQAARVQDTRVVVRAGNESRSRIRSPRRVGGSLARCVSGQRRAGLIEPLPLVVADELVEHGREVGHALVGRR
jgi:hypothetical protein